MRKCPAIEAVNAVVTLVSSLHMRSFSRTGFLTTCVCAGQINTQQLLASGANREFKQTRRRRQREPYLKM